MEMPVSSQLLYFHFCMEADDDGFVGNPKQVIKMVGAGDDDLKILGAKRFILGFKSGVIVIKHWWIHNTLRKDRYNITKYEDELKTLVIKDNGSYTDDKEQGRLIPGASSVPQIKLNKIKLNKKNTTAKADKKSIKIKKEVQFTTLGADVLKSFEVVDPKNKTYYANKTQRAACDFLISEYSYEKVIDVIAALPRLNQEKLYIAQITSPWELQQNWVKLMNIVHQKKVEIIKAKEKYPII